MTIAARYGELFQMSYITRDLDAAMAHCRERLGMEQFHTTDAEVEVLSYGKLRPLKIRAAMASSMPDGHAHHMPSVTESDSGVRALAEALAAVSLHTLAMLLVMGLIAVAVYRWVGVGILRKAWFNLDLIWTGAMAVAGGVTLALALFPMVA